MRHAINVSMIQTSGLEIFIGKYFSGKMSNRKAETAPYVMLPGTSNLGIGNVIPSASPLVDVDAHGTSEVSQTGSFLKFFNVCYFFLLHYFSPQYKLPSMICCNFKVLKYTSSYFITIGKMIMK